MPIKIYYLDDEVDLLSVFTDTFSSPTIEVITFSDPEKAIEAINSGSPDLVFLDYRLPNMTGIDIAKRIRTNVPLILLTADSGVLNDSKTNSLFKAVFTKPFPVEKIEKFIQSF